MWSKQASIPLSFQVYIYIYIYAVNPRRFHVCLLLFISSLFFFFPFVSCMGLLVIFHYCLLMMKGMFTSDEFSLFLLSLRPPRSSSFQLRVVVVVVVVAGGGGGWILCCWKHWIDWEGLWLLWVCCAGTWQARIICGQHIRQDTHAVQGSVKDSFKFPPFFSISQTWCYYCGFFRV